MKAITMKLVHAVIVGHTALVMAAQAQPVESQTSVYMELGRATQQGDATQAATVGLRIPTPYRFFDGRVALGVDAYVSDWRADAPTGDRRNFTQLGLVPMFRWRFDEGRSPWFVEGGIGASYLTRGYLTVNKRFSTHWNFSDHLGVGRSFGAQQRHTLGLYLKHVSNAGVREPNPGETFYVLRYDYAL